jgi:hypothetical protein
MISVMKMPGKDVDGIIQDLGSTSSADIRIGLIRKLGECSLSEAYELYVERVLRDIATNDTNPSVKKEVEIARFRLNMDASLPSKVVDSHTPVSGQSQQIAQDLSQTDAELSTTTSDYLNVERRLTQLEVRLESFTKDTSHRSDLPSTNIISDSFLSRAFAIWGIILLQLIIGLCLLSIYIVFLFSVGN